MSSKSRLFVSKKHLLVLLPILVGVLLVQLPHPELDWSGWMIHPNEQSLEGVVVAITGATSGIGLGLTKTLHSMGATILAIGRSPHKLSLLQDQLQHTRIHTFVADLNNLESVADAAHQIVAQVDRLDYLINNAGMHYNAQALWNNQSTRQGYDTAFGVNYLSHVLLTEKLRPLLQNTTDARIVQMSSSFHWLGDGSDLHSTPPYASRSDVNTWWHRQRSYANTKLAQILHARALQQQHNLSVVSVCPGWVGTNVAGSGWNEWFLRTVAYPNEGYGLASTLFAMFHPHAGQPGNDFVVSSTVFEWLGMVFKRLAGRSWPVTTGIRDALCWTCAIGLLWTQKLTPQVQYTQSSPESYNVSLQTNLYQWSQQAVSEWL